MWQKCPICHGTGKVCSTVSALEWVTCKTCNGTTIISELNGLPPDFKKNYHDMNFLKEEVLCGIIYKEKNQQILEIIIWKHNKNILEINNKKWINTLIFNTYVEHYKHLQLMWLNEDNNKEKLDETVKKLIKINNERR